MLRSIVVPRSDCYHYAGGLATVNTAAWVRGQEGPRITVFTKRIRNMINKE